MQHGSHTYQYPKVTPVAASTAPKPGVSASGQSGPASGPAKS